MCHSVRGVPAFIAPVRPVCYFFLLELGPDFRVPLNFWALSMSAFDHNRMDRLPNRIGAGESI